MFNPPFSSNVNTNIGKLFLRRIDKHFLFRRKYYKMFNTVNLSYSCIQNMTSVILNHNTNRSFPNLVRFSNFAILLVLKSLHYENKKKLCHHQTIKRSFHCTSHSILQALKSVEITRQLLLRTTVKKKSSELSK